MASRIIKSPSITFLFFKYAKKLVQRTGFIIAFFVDKLLVFGSFAVDKSSTMEVEPP